MKKFGLFLLAVLSSVTMTFAQQAVTVNGKITFENDQAPVAGATVSVKGNPSVATMADVNGNYKITIPAGSEQVLVVSFIGMEQQEVPCAKSGTFNIVMKENALSLEDVVVTGYGTVRRASYAGAASVVSTKKLKDIPSVTPTSRIEGNVAGVTVQTTSGEAGAVEKIRIRGVGSLNAGNEPLWVIDGVPMASGSASTQWYNTSGNSIISTLNPNDIETMTVIKDAAAASLYGSRAANGVIVVTTKKGKEGKTSFSAKAGVGFSDWAVNWRPTYDGDTRRDILHLGLYNYMYEQTGSEAASTAFADQYIDDPSVANATEPWSGWTNWKDELFRTGVTQNYEVTASGGNAKTKFYTSLSYNKSDGVSKNADYERTTGNVSVDHTSGRFTLHAASIFSQVNQRVDQDETGYESPYWGVSASLSPADYMYNEDGTYNTTTGFDIVGWNGNPAYTRDYNYDLSSITRSFNNVSGKLNILEGFDLEENLAYDYIDQMERIWWDPRTGNGEAFSGLLQRYGTKDTRLTSKTMLTYNKTWADKHQFSALASWEAEDQKSEYLYGVGMGYSSYKKPEIDNASSYMAGSATDRSTLLSLVAKADYTYDNRYYIGGSFRRDGSSRLSPDTRWGNFWAASAYWRMSNESWWKNGGISNVLSDAKLRASYGQNGTRPSGWYAWQGLYGTGYNYAGIAGMKETSIENNSLTWERNNVFNVGLDLTFIDRIDVSLELYNRATEDLIMAAPTSRTTGFSSTMQNVGAMNNKGIEFTFNAIAIQTKTVNWSIGFNFAYNKNELVSLNEGVEQLGGSYYVNRVGNQLYCLYGLEYAGVNAADGRELFYKNTENADGTIDRSITTNYAECSKVILGDVEAPWRGGINTQLQVKWFDLGATLTWQAGGHIMDYFGNYQSNGFSYNYFGQVPTSANVENSWTYDRSDYDPTNPEEFQISKWEAPIFTYGYQTQRSSRFVYKSDFLRLKNLTIGFNAPDKWLKTLHLQKLRLYASGTNLFTISGYMGGLDPEHYLTDGTDYFEAPTTRTVSFGVEVVF